MIRKEDDDYYDSILYKLRKISFDRGDTRSLVAIVAEFERNGIDRISGVMDTARYYSHCHNDQGDKT